MAWSWILSPLLLLLPPPPLPLLMGTPLTLSTWNNLSSEPSAACRGPGGRCGPGEYWSARRCCQCCPAGHYVEEPCSSPHTRSECVACDTGTYMGHANGLRSCRLCTTCRNDQEMVSDCTPTRDRQCRCKTGEYYCDSEHCPESCQRCTRCPKGKVVLQACNATADTQCGPPGPGAVSRHRLVWVAGWLSSAALGTLVILYVRKPGGGGGPVARGCLLAGCVSPGRPYRRESLVPESSGPSVSSPETRDADALVPRMGARRLPEDDLDMASKPLILPGAPEGPAGVDGPRPEAEAGDEAGPHAGHHGLTLLHPPPPQPEHQAEVPVGRVGAEGPRAAAEEPGRPARPPSRLGDQVATRDGLQSKRSHPGRRGSVVSASDCARKGRKFHFRSRARTWVAGSPLTPCQSPWVRQPVDVSLSRPPPSIPYTPFGDSVEDTSSSKRHEDPSAINVTPN